MARHLKQSAASHSAQDSAARIPPDRPPSVILPAIVLSVSIALVGAALVVAAVIAGPARAADAGAGKKKVATVCAACHGLDGIAKNPDAPNLAGDNPGYIIKQLKAFKSGARQQDQMSIIVQSLSDDDMANVAAWYSSLKVTVTMP